MKGNPTTGFSYLVRGFRMLGTRGLRRYVAVPVAVNVVVFGSLITVALRQFDYWMAELVAWLPDWLDFLQWLLWPLAVLLLLVVVFYTFSILANFIAAPFNGLLAERVEIMLTGEGPPDSGGFLGLVRDLPRSFAKEFSKLGYWLPRAAVLAILMFVPGVNLLAPLLWFALNAWMMALNYCDYPMDNHRHNLTSVRRRVGAERLTSLGFGAGVMAGTMVPFLNFLIMPAAVCGGTLYWVERLHPQEREAAARLAGNASGNRLGR